MTVVYFATVELYLVPFLHVFVAVTYSVYLWNGAFEVAWLVVALFVGLTVAGVELLAVTVE